MRTQQKPFARSVAHSVAHLAPLFGRKRRQNGQSALDHSVCLSVNHCQTQESGDSASPRRGSRPTHDERRPQFATLDSCESSSALSFPPTPPRPMVTGTRLPLLSAALLLAAAPKSAYAQYCESVRAYVRHPVLADNRRSPRSRRQLQRASLPLPNGPRRRLADEVHPAAGPGRAMA